MEFYNNCLHSEIKCAESGRFSVAYIDNSEKPKKMHIHNNLEIYYGITGGKHFIIDDTIYPVMSHDIFIINQFQAHRIEEAANVDHIRYIFSIAPGFLSNLSSPETSLLECFYNQNEYSTRISLSSEDQQKKMQRLLTKLETSSGFGADLMENATLTEIILFIMSISKSTTAEISIPNNRHISDILNYIDQHLDKDLSLDCISAQFYLSKGYLCRLFKEHTCTTIQDYICTKRISRAKQLLSMGYSVQETIVRTGFKDYSNFIRRFKAKASISPKKYAKLNSLMKDVL